MILDMLRGLYQKFKLESSTKAEYRASMVERNWQYAKFYVPALVILLGVISRGHFLRMFSHGNYERLVTFTHGQVFMIGFLATCIFSLIVFLYNGKHKGLITNILWMTILFVSYAIGILDVWAGEGLLGFAIGNIIVASFYSINLRLAVPFYAAYFFSFNFFITQTKTSLAPYGTELVAVGVLTLTLVMIMEFNRIHQFNDRRLIKAQMDKLADSNEQLEEALSARAAFISQMSHEFRTPLNAVICFSEMIIKPGPKPYTREEINEYCTLIYQSGMHLLDVINNTLLLTKNEAGKLDAHLEAVNVAEIVETVVQLFGPECQGKEQNISVDMADGLPKILLDKMMFRQILLNVLSNAVKYTPKKGQINVTGSHEGTHVTVKVSDNGIGMTEEELNHVMQPYNQVNSAYTRGEQGTGLGLSIIQQLMDKLGGAFSMKSQKNQGTTVELTFKVTK